MHPADWHMHDMPQFSAEFGNIDFSVTTEHIRIES